MILSLSYRVFLVVALLFTATISVAQADGMYDPCAGELYYICYPSVSAPNVSLIANPDSVPTATQATNLSWAAENVESCTGSGFNTGGELYGSVSVVPGSTTTYTIECTGYLGAASASVTVSVIPKPDFIVGNVGSVSPTVGNPVTLNAMLGNVGNEASQSPFYYTFTLTGSNNTLYSTGYRSASVEAGASISASGDITFTTAGTYSVVMCADSTSAINETSETNNCSESVQIVVSNAAECSDGLDNDGDGSADVSGASGGTVTGPECGEGVLILEGPYNYSGNSPFGGYFSWPSCEAGSMPADTDCSSASDDNEEYVPQCSDGIDNDGNGNIDYEGVNEPGSATCGNVTTQSGYDGEGHLDLSCNPGYYPPGSIWIHWAYYGNNLQGGMCTGWGFDTGGYAPNGGGGESGGTSGDASVTPTEDTDYGVSCSTDCNIYNGCIDLDGSPAEASGGFHVTVEAPFSANADSGCESLEDNTESPDAVSCVVNNESPAIGESVIYTATAPVGAGSPYTWTASDGATGLGSGATATRSFSTEGVYGMSVTATGAASSGFCPNVTAGDACSNPSPALTVSPSRVRSNEETQVTFTYGATGAASCTLSGSGMEDQTYSANACVVSSGTYAVTLSIASQGIYTLTCDGSETHAVVNVIPNVDEF